MSGRVEWSGMEEFRAALRNLPAHLADEAGGIVVGTAEEAGRRLVDVYPTVTGNLKGGVKVRHEKSGVAASSRVVSSAPHALLYERGTQTRQNKLGANRGAMPAKNAVAKVAIQYRRQMELKLVDLLKRNGFEVSGA